MRSVLCLAVALLGLALNGTARQSTSGTPIEIETNDSLRLYAEWIESEADEQAPLLVLLPMRGATLESFREFAGRVLEFYASDTANPAVPLPHMLLVDLRGHGHSRVRAADTLDYRSMGRADFARMPGDIAQLVKHIITEHAAKIDTGRVMIMGASIGANTAILSTVLMPSVSEVVALSPGSDYHSLRPGDAFRSFAGEVLLVSSRGDTYSFETCQTLATSKRTGWLVKGYPGSKHGTELLYADERVLNDVIEWLLVKRDEPVISEPIDSAAAQPPDSSPDLSSGR